MRAVDVANVFVVEYGNRVRLTNLSLNKLVYFAQVESLRTRGVPLFSDGIEAWQYGPVEPSVYRAFKRFGSGRVTSPFGEVTHDAATARVVADTFAKYGCMTAFDLVDLSHQEGSAWSNVYRDDQDVKITDDDILSSKDGVSSPSYEGTLASGMRDVSDQWPNTLRLLRNA
jgi:uncharacterized phage-associated protein